ncbi:MAG TPA: hypothetical protein VJR89_30535 [Polyangiales bacterium]|nr:hypothetical protein [Polyangiales bacterium]
MEQPAAIVATRRRAHALVLGGALSAWAAWWIEIYWIRGWSSAGWLAGYTWSAIPICACIASISSAVLAPSLAWRRRLSFVGIGSVLCWAALDISRATLFELGRRWLSRSGWPDPWLLTLWIAALGVAGALWFCSDQLLAPLSRWTALLLAAALALVTPLSLATIRAIPALRGQTDAVHAVKMGYPVFWTALLLPLCLWIGRQRGGPSLERAQDASSSASE